MKTTIDITDHLLDDAKRLAASEGTTVRALVEEGLRDVVARRRARPAFHLRDASVAGRGLQPEVDAASWDELRALTYEGRGT